MNKKIKALLFDMDGVLIDAREWHYEALNRVLSLFGMEISRYDHLATFDGLPTLKKLELLSKERGLPKALHSFINRLKQEYTTELIHLKCKPNFSHQYALSQLHRDGFKIAVCSNSIRATIDLMMEKARLVPYLDLVLSNQDIQKAKPDPEIYQKAIRHFDLDPKECLIFEDNPHGIAAAEASGAHVFRVNSVSGINIRSIRNNISLVEGRC